MKKYERFFIPLNKKELPFVWIVALFTNILRVLCLMNWIVLKYFRNKSPKSNKWYDVEVYHNRYLVESWIIFLLIAESLALVLGKPNSCIYLYYLFYIIAVYGLLDILGVTLDELLQPIKLGSNYIRIRSISRWLILAGVNIFQIILCFAILIKLYGNQYCPEIQEWKTAIYQSILTFTTLGYGDYRPISEISKFLVFFQLSFFLLILGFKLPVAISVIKVKVIDIEE